MRFFEGWSRNRGLYRNMARGIPVAAVIVSVAFVACGDGEQLLEPNDPNNIEICIICPGGDLNAWVDSVISEHHAIHNNGLDAALDTLAAEGTGNPLTGPEAMVFARPRVEAYLQMQGITVPQGAWDDVEGADSLFRDGGDLVDAYGGGLSAAARYLTDQLLDIVDPQTPLTTTQVLSELDDLEDLATMSLSGAELEGFIAALGASRGSAEYWDDMLDDWDPPLAANLWRCGWKVLGGDVIGGAFGYLRSFGTPVGTAWGALIGSTSAAVLCD